MKTPEQYVEDAEQVLCEMGAMAISDAITAVENALNDQLPHEMKAQIIAGLATYKKREGEHFGQLRAFEFCAWAVPLLEKLVAPTP